MKVIYPICCGIDVHKTFLVGTIISTTDGVQPHYQKKRFSTCNSDLHCFANWIHLNNCLNVCMESTGKYWVPVYNILEERNIRVTIAIARMILTAIYQMLSTGEVWNSTDLFKVDMPETLKEKRLFKTVKQVPSVAYPFNSSFDFSSAKNFFVGPFPYVYWVASWFFHAISLKTSLSILPRYYRFPFSVCLGQSNNQCYSLLSLHRKPLKN